MAIELKGNGTSTFSNNITSSTGNLTLGDGNLVVADGHGIDFSAAGNAAGMTSELLDDYEEGSFSPIIQGWSGTYGTQFGRYTKIGQLVSIFGEIRTNESTGSFDNEYPGIGGFPFTGNVNGTSAKGMWFCTTGSTGLSNTEGAFGPLDGPGSGSTGAFPNWCIMGNNVFNFDRSNLDASSIVTIRFFISYTTG